MTTDSSATDARHCPACGSPNNCAAACGEKQCWCMAEPVVHAPATTATSCYCRDCLRARTTSSCTAQTQLQKPAIPR